MTGQALRGGWPPGARYRSGGTRDRGRGAAPAGGLPLPVRPVRPPREARCGRAPGGRGRGPKPGRGAYGGGPPAAPARRRRRLRNRGGRAAGARRAGRGEPPHRSLWERSRRRSRALGCRARAGSLEPWGERRPRPAPPGGGLGPLAREPVLRPGAGGPGRPPPRGPDPPGGQRRSVRDRDRRGGAGGGRTRRHGGGWHGGPGRGGGPLRGRRAPPRRDLRRGRGGPPCSAADRAPSRRWRPR
jgi:translation initiation factor IF-2